MYLVTKMKRNKPLLPASPAKQYKITDRSLLSKLVPIQTRRWTLHIIQTVLLAIGWSAIPAALLFAIERLYMPAHFNGVILGIAAIILGFITGIVVAIITGRYSLLGAAVMSDEALGLKERISTAVVLEARGMSDPISQQVKSEARSFINQIKPAKIVPLRIAPKRWIPAGLTCLSGLLLLLPPISTTGATQRQKEFTEVKMMAKPLKDLAEQFEKAPIKELSKDKKMAIVKDMKSLARKFEQGRMPKKEALKKLNTLEKKISDEAKNQSPEAQAEKFKNAVKTAIQNSKMLDSTKKAMAKALNSLDPASQLQSQMNKKPDDAFTVEGLKSMSEKLQQQADKANKEGNKELSKELEKLAKQLSQVSKELQQNQQDLMKILEKMEPAAKTLSKEMKNNNLSNASKKLMENMQKALQECKQSGSVDMNKLEKMNEAIKEAEKALQEGKTADGKKLDKKSAESLDKAVKEMRKYLKEAGNCNGKCGACKQKAADALTIGAKNGMNMGKNQDGQKMMQDLMRQMQQLRQYGIQQSQTGSGQGKNGKNGGKGNQDGVGQSGWGYGTSAMKSGSQQAPNFNKPERHDFKNAGNKYNAVQGEKFYDPVETKTKAYDTQVKGSIGNEGELNMQEFNTIPTQERGSTQYFQTVTNASRAAESSMETEDIPAEYRELVRQYFSQLQEKERGEAKAGKEEKPAKK